MRLAVAGFIGVVCCAAGTAGAVGTDSGSLPGCSAPSVVQTIRERLRGQEGVSVRRLAPIAEAGREFSPGTSTRRYCQARAKLTDGSWPMVFYVIEQRFGAIVPETRFCLDGSVGDCDLYRPRFADR